MTNKSNTYWHPGQKRYVGQVELPRGEDKKRRRNFFYGETGNKSKDEQARVEGQVARAQLEVMDGDACLPSNMTVATLLDAWLIHKKNESGDEEVTIRESTANIYAFWIPYIKDEIGGVKVQELAIPDVKFLMKQLKQAGLANNTRRAAFRILRCALKLAVAEKVVTRNVTDDVTPPPQGTSDMKFLTVEEGKRLLSASKASGSAFYPVIHMALYTGARLGEVLGLQWENITEEVTKVDGKLVKTTSVHFVHQLRDLNGKLITSPCRCGARQDKDGNWLCGVTDGRGPIKTKNGRRSIPLSPEMAADLLRHKERLLKAGLSASPWVFPSEAGTPLGSNNLRRAFKQALRLAGLKEIRFHDLRHTCASVLYDLGFSMLDIQAWLGHSDSSMTKKYTHIFADRRKKQSERLHGVYSISTVAQ